MASDRLVSSHFESRIQPGPPVTWSESARRTLYLFANEIIDCRHAFVLLFVALIELRHSALGPSTMMGRVISNEQSQQKP
jgi:hypothetical protein